MRRWIHLCWVPLLLLALPLAALYYLAYTERGLAVVASHLNGRIGYVTIQLHGVSGTLAHGLHIDSLVIDHRRVHIEIDDAGGRLAILPLAWRTVRVPELHMGRLLVHALPRDGELDDWQPHFLPPLMHIDAEHATAAHWQLITISGEQYQGSALSAAGMVFPDTVRVLGGDFVYNGVHTRTSGVVRAARPIALAGVVHIDAQPQAQPPWTINAHFEGNLARLALDTDVTEPFAAVFHGEAIDLTGHWRWRGQSQVQRFEMSAWNSGDALGVMSAALALEGDHSGFRAQGTLDVPGLAAGPLNADFSGRYGAGVLSVSRLRLRHAASGAIADAQGSITLASGGPRLDLRGEWTQFRWPLQSADAPIHSAHGTYTLQGLRPYAITAQGELRAGELPALQVALRGRFAPGALIADSAEVATLGARSQLAGELHWAPAPIWRIEGRVSDLDVTQLRPGIAGRLSFALRADGRGYDGASDLAAGITDLSGTLRGQRAQGHAQIARRGGDWLFNDVRLQLGSTRIDLDGRVGSAGSAGSAGSTLSAGGGALDLRFALDADDLGLLSPGAHGKLAAHGSVRGDLHDPTLIASAQGRDIDWSGVQLESLDASIAFDPHGSGRVDSTLQVQGLQLADRRLEQLTLRMEGATADHRVALDARAEGLTLALRGSGHYADGQWLARIASAELGNQSRLHLLLENPSQLALSADRLRLDTTCLHDEQAHLCASMTIDAAQRTLALRATDLPMRAMTAGMTPGTEYDGTLGISVDATAAADEPWRGSLDARLADAAIHRHFVNGRVETLELGNGTVTGQITGHELNGELALDAGAAGNITGHLHASGLEADWHDWPLTGELGVDTHALGFVTAYVSPIDRASGRVTGQLALAGTPASPRLSGALNVINGKLDAYQINLSLREVNFSARLEADTLTLEGSALAGPDGHASVSGNLRWQHGLPYGDLHLVGSDLRVLNIPEARVDASPDVALHLAGRRIDLHGQVTLPYARIEPANLANAVLPSGDETIVGADVTPPDEQIKVFSDITLVLGDRVSINTQGLSGRLSGSITVNSDDSGINRGSGELTVEEGKYLAYGRNLDIQRGRLLFSNGLISDPGLDLRAVKKFPDITAGINVRGTLRSPRMTFFSDPEVAQSQIVSLLLAGGSLESLQNSADPTTQRNAGRSDALMQGGAILAQQIGGRFDIEAGVEQDLTNETSLVLGRYLSPRLYISYGVGLVEAINTVKMRYTIGDHWTIKTEAGTQRSADLVFTIEK
jgi:translocation and assembly module TamB